LFAYVSRLWLGAYRLAHPHPKNRFVSPAQWGCANFVIKSQFLWEIHQPISIVAPPPSRDLRTIRGTIQFLRNSGRVIMMLRKMEENMLRKLSLMLAVTAALALPAATARAHYTGYPHHHGHHYGHHYGHYYGHHYGHYHGY
jgi:hypothetical protein